MEIKGLILSSSTIPVPSLTPPPSHSTSLSSPGTSLNSASQFPLFTSSRWSSCAAPFPLDLAVLAGVVNVGESGQDAVESGGGPDDYEEGGGGDNDGAGDGGWWGGYGEEIRVVWRAGVEWCD